MKKEVWKTILQVIIAVLTAVGTTLGVTSCMRFSPIFFVNLHQNKKKHRI